MLQPERLSASDAATLIHAATGVTRHWMARQQGCGSTPLLVLIEDCQRCPERSIEGLAQQLPGSEQERSRMLRQRDDQARFIIARACLRIILATMSGALPEHLQIQPGANGKPFLAETAKLARAPEFNLSHSRDLVLIGVHPTRSIGVDIEWHRPMPDFLAIARRCFDGRTCQRLEALAGEARLREFYDSWCRLEAGLKAMGSGLADDPPEAEEQDCHAIEVPKDYSGAVSVLGGNL